MLKLLAVSVLLKRVRESPESRRRRLAPNAGTDIDGTGTETETESEEYEPEAGVKSVPASELGRGRWSDAEVCPDQWPEEEPAAVSRSAERPMTARRRRPLSATAPPQQQQQQQQQQGDRLRLSVGRLFSMAVLAVLVATVAVRTADQLRQSRALLRRPRLTYGQWLARRPAGPAPEPAVLYGRRRLRFNTSAPVHIRWPDHDTCQHHVIRFARAGQLPAAALVSLPGSGATWLRQLIEGATGVFTAGGTVDVSLYNHGFLGQFLRELDGSTVLQESGRGPHLAQVRLPSAPLFGDLPGGSPKTLDTGARTGKDGARTKRRQGSATPGGAIGKTVLLVQDPRRVLLEGRAADGVEGDDITDFSSNQWRQFVTLRMKQWTFQTQLAVDLADDLLVVHLEELQRDPLGQLARLLQFLKLTVPAERLACLSGSAPPAVRAHGQRAFQDSAVQHSIADHGRQVQQLLQRRGFSLRPEGAGTPPPPRQTAGADADL